MRSRVAEGDPLELLLDTIANVFGGVVLMALVVLLDSQAASAPRPAATEARLERARVEHAEARADLERARRARAALGEAGVRDASLGPLLTRRAELLAAIEAAQAELEARADDRVARGRAAADRVTRRRALEAELSARERSLAEVRLEVEARRRARAREVRLPLRHEVSAAMQRSLLIDGDELYLLPEATAASPVPGVPSATRYTPRAGAGLLAATPEAAQAAFAAAVAGRSPRTTFVSFWVSAGDASFETFQRLRALARERGYEYSVAPHDRAEGVVLSPGRPQAE